MARAATSLDEYRELIARFVSGEMDGSAFERRYLDLFKGDQTMRPLATFSILNALLFDVDAFCADPDVRGDDDIDEDQLRERAWGALAALA